MKTGQRAALLTRATPPTPGSYHCTVPSCNFKQDKDGFCAVHPQLPLRMKKSH